MYMGACEVRFLVQRVMLSCVWKGDVVRWIMFCSEKLGFCGSGDIGLKVVNWVASAMGSC